MIHFKNFPMPSRVAITRLLTGSNRARLLMGSGVFLPAWSQSEFCIISMEKFCLGPLTGTSAHVQRHLAQGFILEQRLKLEGWAVATADTLHMNAALSTSNFLFDF